MEDLGQVDWENPINGSDPLANGIVSAYIVGEDNPLYGTAKLYDLCPWSNKHGTLTNGPTWSSLAPPGGWGSLSFTAASSQYVDLPAVISGYPLTVMGWFNTTTTASNQAVFSLANGAAEDNYFELLLYASGTGKLAAVARNTSFTPVQTTTNFSANVWHHGCAVFGSASDVRAYIDGGNAGSGTGDTPSSLTRASIGDLSRATRTDRFNGRIGDVLIFNRALSAAEVAAWYQESRLGYPSLLNRISRPVAYEAAGAAPATTLHNLMLLGVGA